MEPRLRITRRRGLHLSLGSSVRVHSTLAYKLVVGVDAPLELQGAGAQRMAPVFLVPPGCRQAMRARGVALAVFLDPADGLVACARTGSESRAFAGRLASRLRAACDAYLRQTEVTSDVSCWVDELFALVGRTAPTPLDARVECAMRRVRSDPSIPLATLSDRVSHERLRHLIAEQTGAALRAHRVFLRTMLAAEKVAAGERLPMAAYAAGFADHAHMTRAFGSVFGRAPSSLPSDARVLAPWTER